VLIINIVNRSSGGAFRQKSVPQSAPNHIRGTLCGIQKDIVEMNKSEIRIKITDLLKEEELSSKEIGEKLGVETKLVSPIISELKKQGRIHSVSPRKFFWGIRHENEQNEFLIKKYEWVKLEKYELKIFYKATYTFSGYSENEHYVENHSVFEIHRGDKVLMPIDVIWFDNEKGKRNEVLTEVSTHEEIFRIILKYTAVSSNSMKIMVKYERREVKLSESEKKAVKEEEDEIRKQISNWMEENFK